MGKPSTWIISGMSYGVNKAGPREKQRELLQYHRGRAPSNSLKFTSYCRLYQMLGKELGDLMFPMLDFGFVLVLLLSISFVYFIMIMFILCHGLNRKYLTFL